MIVIVIIVIIRSQEHLAKMDTRNKIIWSAIGSINNIVMFLLYCSPNELLEDTRNLVFDCTFERDFCGLDLHGVVYRGRRTESQNTGPDHGARHTRTLYTSLQSHTVLLPN